jgi:hypothetical protein
VPGEDIYDNNSNCQSYGYQFGYKMDGCRDYDGYGMYGDFSGLDELVPGNAADYCVDPDVIFNVGSVLIECKDYKFVDIDIIGNVDAIIVKGGNNVGKFYRLNGETSLQNLGVGNGQDISHIEFCFSCDTPSPTSPPSAP